jgi:hypothetical protein
MDGPYIYMNSLDDVAVELRVAQVIEMVNPR